MEGRPGSPASSIPCSFVLFCPALAGVFVWFERRSYRPVRLGPL